MSPVGAALEVLVFCPSIALRIAERIGTETLRNRFLDEFLMLSKPGRLSDMGLVSQHIGIGDGQKSLFTMRLAKHAAEDQGRSRAAKPQNFGAAKVQIQSLECMAGRRCDRPSDDPAHQSR